ncbi:MAG: hypothetical protein K0Q79_2039 [Flavipsychrobacter sp.]|nr:hypothetical protein [Flavipsychrobacter sp.]
MKNILLLCAGVIVLIASCKKPETLPSTTSTFSTYSSMDTIYQMLEVKPKYVTVNGGTGGTFYGTSGTRYVIPPNCLQDGAGNPVIASVQFEVAEYLKKGDMIFSGVLPQSDNNELISGGEFYISATLSGQKIYLKPGCTCLANIPRNGDTTDGMEFFAGRPGPDSIKNKVNWKKNDSAGIVRPIVKPFDRIKDTLEIISDSFRFCNADRLGLSGWKYQTFKITIMASNATLTSTDELHTYAFYDNYKSFWNCSWYGGPVDNVYSEHHVPDIPVHFVSYALINKRFYAGVTAATPKTGENYTVTLFETDPAQFKAQLNNLTK